MRSQWHTTLVIGRWCQLRSLDVQPVHLHSALLHDVDSISKFPNIALGICNWFHTQKQPCDDSEYRTDAEETGLSQAFRLVASVFDRPASHL